MKHLEGVGPVVLKEAGDTPEHGEGLDGSCCLGASHVCRLPSEVVEDAGDLGLCVFVPAAEEHSGAAFFELGVDHAVAADGVEGLDEVGVGEFGLEGLHERLVGAGEELEDAVIGWSVLGGVSDVDDGLGAEVLFAGGLECLGGGAAFDGENDDVTEGSGIGEGAGVGGRVGLLPFFELAGIAGAERDLVAMLEESAAESFCDIA